ncbi:hypothetical protein JR316_0008709 [Psilocybe cubensis]|uniref:Uncharacterized protein n=1 Tax=Psilocybe cubensis TaxID=181762 RepID=A0ACB8GSQ4_PSICU|nr:hypothetical protein JR316_0008709 [Psilocybe cubensis]KAH9478256.1 hypothetical protein JR316_0008709 [Psilocybe cubensis]
MAFAEWEKKYNNASSSSLGALDEEEEEEGKQEKKEGDIVREPCDVQRTTGNEGRSVQQLGCRSPIVDPRSSIIVYREMVYENPLNPE